MPPMLIRNGGELLLRAAAAVLAVNIVIINEALPSEGSTVTMCTAATGQVPQVMLPELLNLLSKCIL